MSSIAAGTTTTTGYVVTSDSTGALVLKTGASATTAMTIDTSQNVGIGTGSPTSKLTIGAGSFSAAGAQTTGMYTNGTSGLVILTDALLIGTRAGADRMTLDSSGNLGIGAGSPVSRLYVKQSNNTSSTGGLIIENSANDTRLFTYFNVDQDAWVISASYDTNGAYKPFAWYTSDTRRMTLAANGNLGIGTTSNRNSTKLDVFGDITFGGNASYYGTLAYNAGVGTLDLTSSDGGFRFIRRSGSVTSATIDSSGNFRVADGQLQASAGSGDAYMARLSCAYNFPTVDTYLDSVAGTSYSGQIMFRTSSSGGAMVERARVTSVGDFLVGTTSYSTGGIEKTIVVSGSASAGFQLARSAAVAAYIYTYGSAGYRVETTSSYARVEFVPGGSGGVQLASAGATSWTSLSDERTKTDLVPITDAIHKVSSLRAVTGRFIKDDPEKSRSFLIAQDFVDVFPQAVTPYNEKDNETEYLGLAYTDTIPLLVAAIKEQQAIIQQLQADVAALKGTA